MAHFLAANYASIIQFHGRRRPSSRGCRRRDRYRRVVAFETYASLTSITDVVVGQLVGRFRTIATTPSPVARRLVLSMEESHRPAERRRETPADERKRSFPWDAASWPESSTFSDSARVSEATHRSAAEVAGPETSTPGSRCWRCINPPLPPPYLTLSGLKALPTRENIVDEGDTQTHTKRPSRFPAEANQVDAIRS